MPGHGIDGFDTLTSDLEALVDRVKDENIFRTIARKKIGSMVTSLLSCRPRTINRYLLVTTGRTITIGAVERVPVIGRRSETVGKNEIHLTADGRRVVVRPVGFGVHPNTAGWVPPAKRSIAHNIHLGRGLQCHQRHHKRKKQSKRFFHNHYSLELY